MFISDEISVRSLSEKQRIMDMIKYGLPLSVYFQLYLETLYRIDRRTLCIICQRNSTWYMNSIIPCRVLNTRSP